MDKALSPGGGVMIYHQRAPVCLCAPARTNELSKCVVFALCNLECVMRHDVYKRAMAQLLLIFHSRYVMRHLKRILSDKWMKLRSITEH